MDTITNYTKGFSCLLFLITSSLSWGRVIEDFNDGKLSEMWVASSGMVLQRSIVRNTVLHDGVEGKMLKVVASKGGYFATKSNLPSFSFELFKEIKFRINAKNASVQEPIVFEFQVFATDREAWRWRKVEITKPGWQTVVLPTRFFRHSSFAYLKWDQTRRFAFRFRNAGVVEIDKIELVDDSSGSLGSQLRANELSTIAFEGKSKVFRSGNFYVISNVPDFEGEKILDSLNEFKDLFYSDFPTEVEEDLFIPLLIFDSKQKYQKFWTILSEKFNSLSPTPTSDGYAMLGIAGSYFDSALGFVRPVYIHEVCHALIARRFGIASQGGWLQEGLANYYQLKWGQKDTRVYARNLLINGQIVPLSNLLNGRRVGMKNYAQVVLFYEWLLSTRKEGLDAVIREVSKQGSSNLEPLAKAYLGQSIVHLEEEWIQWLKTR